MDKVKRYMVVKPIFGIPTGSYLEAINGCLFFNGKLKFSTGILLDMPDVFEPEVI